MFQHLGHEFTILRIRPVLNDKMPCQGFVVGCYLVDGAVLFPSHATNRQDKQLHPIPPGLNRCVVTLSELWEIVSVAPSEVGTLYCSLMCPRHRRSDLRTCARARCKYLSDSWKSTRSLKLQRKFASLLLSANAF